MPSAKKLRAKRKEYYQQNVDKVRSKQKEYYKKVGKAKADVDYQINRKQKMTASRDYSKANYALQPEKKEGILTCLFKG